MKIRIGVIGSDANVSEDILGMSERIGRDVARRNCILVCCGRGGVMEAACRGARMENGLSVGILPSLDRADANPYVDVALTTGMSYSRNALVVSSSDAVIAVNGRAGTLSEAGLALSYGKIVVAVKGSGGVAEYLSGELGRMGINKRIHVASAEDAVDLALKLIE